METEPLTKIRQLVSFLCSQTKGDIDCPSERVRKSVVAIQSLLKDCDPTEYKQFIDITGNLVVLCVRVISAKKEGNPDQELVDNFLEALKEFGSECKKHDLEEGHVGRAKTARSHTDRKKALTKSLNSAPSFERKVVSPQKAPHPSLRPSRCSNTSNTKELKSSSQPSLKDIKPFSQPNLNFSVSTTSITPLPQCEYAVNLSSLPSISQRTDTDFNPESSEEYIKPLIEIVEILHVEYERINTGPTIPSSDSKSLIENLTSPPKKNLSASSKKKSLKNLVASSLFKSSEKKNSPSKSKKNLKEESLAEEPGDLSGSEELSKRSKKVTKKPTLLSTPKPKKHNTTESSTQGSASNQGVQSEVESASELKRLAEEDEN